MSSGLAFVLGVAGGLFLARVVFTAPESACCAEVAKGVRAQVQSSLGNGAVAIGDIFNLWGPAAGLASNLQL